MPTSSPTNLPHGASSASRSEFHPRVRSSQARPLWVWWHLLSLDAPTVAIVWCWFFGAVFHLKFPWATLPTLALGTWCVYVADRLLDGWRSGDTAMLRDRHWFYLRHRKSFVIAWALAAIPLAYLIFFRVDPPVRTDDMILCLIGVAYFVLIHGRASALAPGRLFPAWFPKELAVGFLFAVATAVPAWVRLNSFVGLPAVHRIIFFSSVFTFGAICWLNCVAIQTWEDREADREIVHTILSSRGLDDAGGHSRGLTRYLGARLTGFACLVCILALSLTIVTAGSRFYPLFCSVTFSAGVFLGLIRYSHRFSALSLRIAADAALITPLLFLFVIR